ncbi:hypothetical protein [Nucisporomicrobium flavum]|uniref:hypothetical protein n=1 Tax=Nucisporomicrobium flavum TaxID=2785915 RepID=UPI0018F53DBC|nr:hypothetical protein [Nucisporomicrobium flavum]
MEKLLTRELLPTAFARFRDLLEDDSLDVRVDGRYGDGDRDAVWEVRTARLTVEITVRGFSRFTPRHVDQLIGELSRLRSQSILVVAPWLSPRSRQLLAEQRINHLDLTGNGQIRVPGLPILVHTEGATSDPFPSESPRRGLQGRSVNGLVRALVDHAPPYRITDLARVAGVSPAYASRTVEALGSERLLRRGANRMIEEVDWSRLLRERARHYSLIKSNRGSGYVARAGLDRVVRDLGSEAVRADSQMLVTGSYAVREIVTVAAPAQLALYVPDPVTFAEEHQLLPADRGANVLLLRAAHPSQLTRARVVRGALHAGLSQVALDCLSGNGRLPEEGEALIEWMEEHTGQWRSDYLTGD